MPFVIEAMDQDDIQEVGQVEQQCFSNPWPPHTYRRELRDPMHNYYVVARWRPAEPAAPAEQQRGSFYRLPFVRRTNPVKPPILGFGGLWNMLDEAHITTIGVQPNQRGRSLGEMLFLNLLDEAIRRHCRWVTLEVRVSNTSAQALYEKYGLTRQGIRKRYYSDNGEDAHIMWSPALDTPAMQATLQELRAKLDLKLARWHDSPHGEMPNRAEDQRA